LVKLLVKRGTQDDLEDDISKKLLLSAAKKGDEEVVRLLLEPDMKDNDTISNRKVDVYVRDKRGWTPLSWATEGGHKAVVELLLKSGAKVDCEYIISVSKLSVLSIFFYEVDS
jgi:ankyrin repeat protein